MAGTLSLPVISSANSTEDIKIRDTLTALNGLLTAANLLDGAQLGALSVPAANLAANAVTTAKITDLNVTTPKLADLAVTTAKIADANVTAAKLASASVSLVFQTAHTFAIQSTIAVPSGDTDFIPPFFVPKSTNQTVKLAACRYKINSGTSATCKIQVNGADATGFTGISVTTTSATTNPADVTLAADDRVALVVTAVSGSPVNLSFTIYLEHTVTN